MTERVATKILVVELEPTHYKVDLWNALVQSAGAEVTVVYAERKNWSPDGGHDYQRFPPARFQSIMHEGSGWLGALSAGIQVLQVARRARPDMTYIAGYVHLQTVLVIVHAALTSRPFVVHADVFNNGRPSGRLAGLKLALRETLRRLVFRHARAVLVCGRRGVEAAVQAGCPPEKVRDFPYSISVKRILSDQPGDVPAVCEEDLRSQRVVVFFSGRMIARKGLPTLLQAMAKLKSTPNWVLWVEGAGPEMETIRGNAQALGLADRCRFLGFCQYDLHSWLVRCAEIVVVPSFEDSWGIVVDEALQLGKAVVSTHATGSALDRIVDGENGFIVPPRDVLALTDRLGQLLDHPALRARLGRQAMSGPKNIRPTDNVATLVKVMEAS